MLSCLDEGQCEFLKNNLVFVQDLITFLSGQLGVELQSTFHNGRREQEKVE